MNKKTPERSTEVNSKEVVLTPFFNEKKLSSEQTDHPAISVFKPEVERSSEESIIETRCIPYPTEQLNSNRNNDHSILSKNNITYCDNNEADSALGNSVGEIIENLIEKTDKTAHNPSNIVQKRLLVNNPFRKHKASVQINLVDYKDSDK